jgi:hypothetical protein
VRGARVVPIPTCTLTDHTLNHRQVYCVTDTYIVDSTHSVTPPPNPCSHCIPSHARAPTPAMLPRAVPPWAAIYTCACIRWLLCMQLRSLKSLPPGVHTLVSLLLFSFARARARSLVLPLPPSPSFRPRESERRKERARKRDLRAREREKRRTAVWPRSHPRLHRFSQHTGGKNQR